MRPTISACFLLLAVAFAYFFVRSPLLNQYAIQAIAASTVVYFTIRRLKQNKPWRPLPAQGAWEMIFVTFSLLLVIGKTGNLSSPLYPLTYIHLFFLVMSVHPLVAICVMAGAVLFHFSLAPTLDTAVFVHLLTLPIVMIFFMFAKEQHEEVVLEKQQLRQEEQLLDAQQAAVDALKQELDQSRQLLTTTKTRLQTWQKQFFSCEPGINLEIEKLTLSLDNPSKQENSDDQSKA